MSKLDDMGEQLGMITTARVAKLVAVVQAAQRLLDSPSQRRNQACEVLEKALVALDTTLHRDDEIRREIDDLECKIDELERELERETGDCEGFAID